MKHTIYLAYKDELRYIADGEQTSDKPMRRMALNDYTDSLTKRLSLTCRRETISQKQYDLYSNWLVNYCIKRHAK